MSKKIGFVGLGTMGFPMAVNLKKAGFQVIGFDAYKGIYEKARSAGITMVETLKEMAEQADAAIISMVRDYKQNVDVILGDDGLLTAPSKHKTIIVMSLITSAICASRRSCSRSTHPPASALYVTTGYSPTEPSGEYPPLPLNFVVRNGCRNEDRVAGRYRVSAQRS